MTEPTTERLKAQLDALCTVKKGSVSHTDTINLVKSRLSERDRLEADLANRSERCRLLARQVADLNRQLGRQPATDDDEEILHRAIGEVLFNVRNFPESAQSRLLGQDMRPLNEMLTEVILSAGFRLRHTDGADL